MKKDVFISIKGIQRVEGEEEVTELMTVGYLCRGQNGYLICYDDTEATGYEGARTSLRVDGNKVTLKRSLPYRSQLIVEKGIRHQCRYGTAFGDLYIGVLGSEIAASIDDSGGEVACKYSLDVNTELCSEHELYVNVREM